MPFSTLARCCVSATLAALVLAACGGGGSDSPALNTPPAVTSATLTFPLAAAMADFLRQAKSTPFTVAGTGSGNGQVIEFTGSGTSVEVNSAGTFNGLAAVVKNTTVTGSLQARGTSVPFTQSSSQFFDSNYKPLGASGPGAYCVFSAQTALPTMVRIGDSGSYYAASCYASSTRTTLLETVAITYALAPESGSRAIFKLTSKSTNAAGVTNSLSTNYSISTDGVLRPTDTPLVGLSSGGVTVDAVMKFQ